MAKQVWELEWTEFHLPDGYKASYSIDGQDVRMMVDEDQIPPGLDYSQRLNQCYDHFFTQIYPTLN